MVNNESCVFSAFMFLSSAIRSRYSFPFADTLSEFRRYSPALTLLSVFTLENIKGRLTFSPNWAALIALT